MKILILLFAQIIVTVQGTNKTPQYAVSVAQQKELNDWKAATELAHTLHNHELFSIRHHEYWKACQRIKAEIKAPATAVCDLDKGIIRGQDAK